MKTSSKLIIGGSILAAIFTPLILGTPKKEIKTPSTPTIPLVIHHPPKTSSILPSTTTSTHPFTIYDSKEQKNLEEQLDTESKDHLKRIIKAGSHLSTLIDDILQLSKITRSELHFGSIDLSALTETILQRYKDQEPERKAHWIVEPALEVVGDKQLIELMMENLIGNAWKFTRNVDETEISFTTDLVNGGKVFVVRDNGAGFNMHYSNKLFREFQRLHGVDEFEGTGIGLATVKRILDRHGGNIWADSEPNKGASFFFTL